MLDQLLFPPALSDLSLNLLVTIPEPMRQSHFAARSTCTDTHTEPPNVTGAENTGTFTYCTSTLPLSYPSLLVIQFLINDYSNFIKLARQQSQISEKNVLKRGCGCTCLACCQGYHLVYQFTYSSAFICFQYVHLEQ